MLARLATGEFTISELAEPFDISLPAISKHVRVLEDAGLLVRERDGRLHRCNIDPKPIAAATDWLEEMRRFWESRLDALADYFERMGDQWPKPKLPPKSSSSAERSQRHGTKSSAPGRTRRR